MRNQATSIFAKGIINSTLFSAFLLTGGSSSLAEEELPRLTTLSDTSLKYTVPEKHYVVLSRSDIEAVIVDNSAVDDEVLPGHKAGYSGVGKLVHMRRQENLFVPSVAGLNFEHIHDGTTRERTVLYEPRQAPMELRVIDPDTVELYQAPTPTWKLESCQRYHLLPDGAIELTFECIPHEEVFKNGYIGLFWASYIHQPKSLDIYLRGPGADDKQTVEIRGITPSHGELATHLSVDDQREFAHDEDFPLSLVFNRSQHRFARPYYYGISHNMAYVQIFRPQDQIRITQSPSGGGMGNPAWDFQYFIPEYKVGQRYQMVMRTMYFPFESYEETERLSRPHRKDLAK